MKIDFSKKRQKNEHFIDDAAKTRGVNYLNVETCLLFAPPMKISGYAPAWSTPGIPEVLDIPAPLEALYSAKHGNSCFYKVCEFCVATLIT